MADGAFTELASVDGRITPTDEATISLRDDGLYRGDGAFEVIRLYEGRPFALDEHLDRLERSSAAIELDFDRTALEEEIEALLSEAGEVQGQLRLIVTRGGRRIAATEPIPAHSETVRLATVTYSPSVILNGVKSLSYAANMQATRLAGAQGADEAVLVRPDGTVLEPPTSSIFWVSPQGGLRTPALEVGVLESITRDRMVRTLHVEEGAWPAADLRSAHEAFLASTTREIQAVSAIDGADLAEAPGPRTREAQKAFAATLQQELDQISAESRKQG
ncbi:MAG TPA: aminotransferase class IV [Solirubrobacterales bacterium]|jgi:branched-chain amino acid aminotransferase